MNQRAFDRAADGWLGVAAYQTASGTADAADLGDDLSSTVGSLLSQADLTGLLTLEIAPASPAADPTQVATPSDVAKSLSFARELTAHLTGRAEAAENATIGQLAETLFGALGVTPTEIPTELWPRVEALVSEWQSSTGCTGLNDEDAVRRPHEAGILIAGIIRAVAETGLIEAAFKTVVTACVTATTEGSDATRGLLGVASEFIAARTVKQLEEAFAAAPDIRERLTSPAAKALVEWERRKHGWIEDDDGAVSALKSALDLEMATAQGRRASEVRLALRRTLASASRRHLTSTLIDAARGRLRPRLGSMYLEAFEQEQPKVTLQWESPRTAQGDGGRAGIGAWLFRGSR